MEREGESHGGQSDTARDSDRPSTDRTIEVRLNSVCLDGATSALEDGLRSERAAVHNTMPDQHRCARERTNRSSAAAA